MVSKQASLGQVEMRLVRSRDHAEADRFVGKQFVQRASDADFGISFTGERSVALDNAGQFHAGYPLNNGCVKCLSRQSEANDPDSNHMSFLSFLRNSLRGVTRFFSFLYFSAVCDLQRFAYGPME